MSRRPTKPIVIVLGVVAVAAALIAAVLWLYAESHTIEVREIRVELPNFPAADDGLAIAVASDFHFGPDDAPRAAECAGIINRLEPDLILLLGDFINGSPNRRDSMSMEELSHFAASLRARRGVFAVTGNHEWYGRAAVENALRAGGVEILSGKTKLLPLGSGKLLQLGGMPDYKTQVTLAPPEFAPGLPTVALMHDPNSAELLPPSGVFGVAGHTHGGQFRIHRGTGRFASLRLLILRIRKRLGMIHSLSRPLVLFDMGFTEFRGRRIFITRGVGAERIRIRTFCRPEIVLMRVFAADEEARRNRYIVPEEFAVSNESR